MGEDFGITGHIFNSDYEWEDAGEGVRRKILGFDNDLMLVLVEFKKGSEGYVHKHPHKQIYYQMLLLYLLNMDRRICS